MKKRATIAIVLALIVMNLASYAQAPTVSEKKDVAILSLGYYGWIIPLEALGSIDSGIQRVFSDLGRFNVIGMTQRLSSADLGEFVAAIKKDKASSFVMPDKYRFGEATFTEGDYNRILGSFLVAVPIITTFNSSYSSSGGRWETRLDTEVTFIDVAAGGSVVGVARVSTTGTDKENQLKSVSGAIDAIPSQLQYEIRSIPAFQINTRILSVSGGEVRLQLGANMGLKKGDEYSVIVTSSLEGLRDEREAGLILIREVGPEISTATILYGGKAMAKDAQLREIPRVGTDVELFLRYLDGPGRVHFMPGLRAVPSRGFYGLRPYASVAIPLGVQASALGISVDVLPINVVVGGQFDLHLGRLTLAPYAGIGIAYIYSIEGLTVDTSKNYFPFLGGQAGFQASWLVSRDMRVFVEGGAEYWLATNDLFSSYGGISAGAGVSWKL
jgi:hypothetical protein